MDKKAKAKKSISIYNIDKMLDEKLASNCLVTYPLYTHGKTAENGQKRNCASFRYLTGQDRKKDQMMTERQNS